MAVDSKISLPELNALGADEARDFFLACCSSSGWATGMVASRPFASMDELRERAEALWFVLGEDDFLEAFAGHPRIGDIETLREKYAHTRELAAGEQSGAAGAGEEILAELKTGNDQYFEKFGFIFIVFATGKSAAEMLALLKERLPNDRARELENAAAEQNKITLLRLEKAIAPA